MKKFVIERDLPGVGGMNGDELCGAAAKSNEALNELAGKVQWQHSYVAGDKTFCIYLAENPTCLVNADAIATRNTKIHEKREPSDVCLVFVNFRVFCG